MPKFLLDLLFPIKSLSGKPDVWVDGDDARLLQSDPFCVYPAELRRRGIQSLDRLVAYSRYDELPLLRTAIHTFKYKRVSSFGEYLGRLLARASLLLPLDEQPALCPVPIHWTRQFQRGFNQSRLLAEVVGRTRGWRVLELLKRTRPTGHQAWRARTTRKRAVRNVFSVRSDAQLPPYIVLIDDIATSGATLDACAYALKEAGVLRVDALVLAQG